MSRIIITGATSGIGLATARALGAMGHELILGCRNMTKANKLQRSLKEEGIEAKIFQVDLTHLASVEGFCDGILKAYDHSEDFKNEYLSLTDIARYKSDEPFIVINNWMRGKDTIEFLGLWEQLHNPDFKPIEFDRFKTEAGYNAFTLSPQKWIGSTNAIGIVSKSGRYGGTFAHSDIAFEFASWISAEFKLYIIKDYRRLKTGQLPTT